VDAHMRVVDQLMGPSVATRQGFNFGYAGYRLEHLTVALGTGKFLAHGSILIIFDSG